MRGLRECIGVGLLVLGVPFVAEATTQNFYLHYSTGGVSVPGGSTNYYLNQTAPTAGTPTVYGAVSVNAGATINFPTFTATALGSSTALERLVTITLNLSANHVMNTCVDMTATLERVSSGGTVTALGTGSVTNVSLPQGSGGGLSGYQPKTIPLEMDIDRTIASGASLRIRVSLTNSCASNASVRLIFDGTPAQSTTKFETPDVTIFGAAGTFGSLDGSLANGVTLARSYVPNWSTDPGQGFFFPTVAAGDGTLFVSNFYQSYNAFVPTSCDTVVSCFNPDSKECPVSGGSNDYFSNIRIPNASGNIYTPTLANPLTCGSAASQGGADISDVEAVDTDRILYVSSNASAGGSTYPAIGEIDKSSGTWTAGNPRYPTDLASDPGVGSTVCPGAGTSCGFLNELARFPDSGRVVVAQYFAAPGSANDSGVAVVDDNGVLLAYRPEPTSWTDAHGCLNGSGQPLGIIQAAKSVEVDPTSTVPDERFVVSYDNWTNPNTSARSFVIQEFSYDDTTGTITPISAPIFTASPTGATQISTLACATASPRQGQGAIYDSQGNMWVQRRGTIMNVFLKSGGTRRTETDPACAYQGSLWGVDCPADLEFPSSVSTAVGGPYEDAGPSGTGVMTQFSRFGDVDRFKSTGCAGGAAFCPATTYFNLGLSQLPSIPSNPTNYDELVYATRTVVDTTRRIAWVPVQARPFPKMFGPPILPGEYQQPQWIYAVDLSRVAGLP